jgi:tetratricopeptide (TPR) repeat protein
MLPEQWQKLEEIFQTAADLPPDSQTVYLDDACRGDLELRREVEAMLAASPLGLIESAIADTADELAEDPDRDPLVGTWLGPYRIDGVLGRGGMGAVYRAFREDDQFHKQVAIKVIPRMLAGPDVVARFRSERQILANLEHSNIARLFDGGTTEGIPYLVMEYVEGVPITQYVAEKALAIPDRLRLMQSVCGAVLYAHHNLVIHRDLKPANILVTADGTVKLLDFGVAKLVEPSGDGALTPQALTSQMMMTPDYASPEQIRGEPVTTASDVYSLGVVFYEVLTGERPYRITSPSWHDLERVVCKTEPRKPSTLETLPSRTRRRLAGDLDNIVLMALRKDVSRRYGSAEQLSEDIRRHLQGLPIQARRDTLVYRSGKFLRRNQWAVTAAFLVAGSLVTGTVIAVRQARAAQARFDQLRGFARTVLVDLHAQLSDIPGTAKARQALIAHVDDYLKRVVAEHAGDDTALATEFATTYLRLGEMQGATPEAIASLEKGRLLLERKRKRGTPDPADVLVLARLRVTAGSTLMDLGRTPEAIENLLAAESLAAGLRTTIGPNAEAELLKAWADWRLARIYRMQYLLQKGEEHGRRAVAACEDLLQRGVRTREMYEILNGARNVLAGVLRRQGRWQQSMELYQKVLDDTERRAAEDPSSAGLQRDLARTHQIVGDMVSRVPGHRKDAQLHVRSAIAIAERLAALDPSDKTAQSELGQYLSSGGETLNDPGDWKEAVTYLRRALPIFERLLKDEPNNSVIQLYTALTEADLGEFQAMRTLSRDSIPLIRLGFSRMAKLVERDPENTIQYLELLSIQRRLVHGLALVGQGREALSLGQDLIDKERVVAAQAGPRQELKYDLPKAYSVMAAACRALGKRDEARKWYRSAIGAWEAILSEGRYSPDAVSALGEAKMAEHKMRGPGE